MPKSITKKAKIVSFRTLLLESDKGCTIIIASVLEEVLRQLHEAHIAVISCPAKKNIFDNLSAPYAPLATFAGKIQIAYGYGLISSDDYEDLQVIRKLRNEAAHSIYDFSLEDDGVRAVVMQLKADSRCKQPVQELEKNSGESKPVLKLPKLTETKRHLILNGLALQDIIQEKLVDTLERLLVKRKTIK